MRGDDAPSDLLPGRIASSDLLATLLGAPDAEISDASPLEEKPGLVTLRLEGRDECLRLWIEPLMQQNDDVRREVAAIG